MVVLARSFAAKPKFLLIDEMSLGLAPVVFLRLIPIIQQIAKRGRRAARGAVRAPRSEHRRARDRRRERRGALLGQCMWSARKPCDPSNGLSGVKVEPKPRNTCWRRRFPTPR